MAGSGAALAILATAGMGGACSVYGPTASVLVELPEPPPHWRAAFPRLGAVVEFPSPEGGQGRLRLASWETGAAIVVSKRTNGCFLAWPTEEEAGDGLLRPAGALWPLDTIPSARGSGRSAIVRLSWAEGPLALLASRLEQAGVATWGVNTVRLGDRMAAAADPWTWDLDGIAQALAAGTFAARDLDRLPSADVTVAAGPGGWFLESPFVGTIAATVDGRLRLAALSYGMHTLCSTNGGHLRVWLDATGVIMLP